MSVSSAPNGSPPTYLMFDGIDNYVEVGSSPPFSVATTGALTVSVRMMPQVLTFTHSVRGYVHWLGKGTGCGNSGQNRLGEAGTAGPGPISAWPSAEQSPPRSPPRCRSAQPPADAGLPCVRAAWTPGSKRVEGP
jgi:hypothetical protein